MIWRPVALALATGSRAERVRECPSTATADDDSCAFAESLSKHHSYTATPGGSMRFLLTSAGIKNTRIGNALVDLLGKPIAESGALCIPTAAYGDPMAGPGAAWRFISGRESRTPMCELGWKSLGVLELTAVPSIDEELWVPLVQEADALLVGGGDALYLCYWMRQSGLADLLPSLREAVYVGVSGGAWASSASTSTSFTGRTTARGRRWRSRGAHWTRSATRERCAGSACATSPSTCSGAASPCGMWTRSRRSSRC